VTVNGKRFWFTAVTLQVVTFDKLIVHLDGMGFEFYLTKFSVLIWRFCRPYF